MPPATFMVMEPLLYPLHDTFITGTDVTTGAAELATATVPLLVHPEASVTRTL